LIDEYNKEKRGVGGRRSCCRECRNQYLKQWRELNADHSKEYRRKRAPVIRENKIKWRRNNIERVLEWEQQYRDKNRERKRLINARREARKKILPDNMTEEKLSFTLDYFKNGCALSGTTEELRHLDHTIPIAIGHGGTTFGNIIPLSETLNTSKGDSNIFEWFEANRQRFELSQDKFDRLIGFLAEANEMSIEDYRKFVFWCHENPRTLDDIRADNKRYGHKKPSVEIWRERREEGVV